MKDGNGYDGAAATAAADGDDGYILCTYSIASDHQVVIYMSR